MFMLDNLYCCFRCCRLFDQCKNNRPQHLLSCQVFFFRTVEQNWQTFVIWIFAVSIANVETTDYNSCSKLTFCYMQICLSSFFFVHLKISMYRQHWCCSSRSSFIARHLSIKYWKQERELKKKEQWMIEGSDAKGIL